MIFGTAIPTLPNILMKKVASRMVFTLVYYSDAGHHLRVIATYISHDLVRIKNAKFTMRRSAVLGRCGESRWSNTLNVSLIYMYAVCK